MTRESVRDEVMRVFGESTHAYVTHGDLFTANFYGDNCDTDYEGEPAVSLTVDDVTNLILIAADEWGHSLTDWPQPTEEQILSDTFEQILEDLQF